MKKSLEKIIINYLLVYKPEIIGIFGSYARNEYTPESDLDILVSFKKPITLIDLSRITNELSERIKIKVDLVTKNSLHPKLKTYIEKDLQIIYQD
ncbi:MAG: nucleotidyltransferase family protein [Bacteroidales bacterium]|nr:nucleotidyltransferase family protein [Bacteroidales bacterium]MBN2758576.1 nucleotidyltransferase family protein [Bacteroidales bacterium]